MDTALFDAGFFASLHGLRLRRRRARAADRTGDRAAGGRGGRVSFAGHRPYAPGDPVRHLDWAAWMRTGRLFVKEFEREASDRLLLAVDASASMATFDKWTAARRLAAAAALLALQAEARVEVHLLRDGAARRLASVRGRRGWMPLLEALSGAATGGPTDLARGLGALPRPPGHGGRLVLISDFLDPGDWGAPLERRAARGEEAVLVEVLAPEERVPSARGVLDLVDPEDPAGGTLRVRVGEPEAAAYAATMDRRLADHAQLARRLRGSHLLARTEDSAAEVLAPLCRGAAEARR